MRGRRNFCRARNFYGFEFSIKFWIDYILVLSQVHTFQALFMEPLDIPHPEFGKNMKKSDLKNRRPKVGDKGEGTRFCIKMITMGPNDLIFFQ